MRPPRHERLGRGRVSWSRPGRLGVFGALFDGASERTDTHEGWATSMRLGDGASVPMVA